MKRPGRLEWKLLGGALAVALLAVGTATVALRFALGSFAAFARQHQEEVSDASNNAEAVFRGYFARQKQDFRRRAAAYAESHPLTLEGAARVTDLLRARLIEAGRPIATWAAPREVAATKRESPAIVEDLAGVAGAPPRQLELVFGIPQSVYESYLALRASLEREKELDRAYAAFLPEYLRKFMLVVLSVLMAAPLLGLWFARRITRRVARLSEAARRVGEGDLGVRVAPRGHDELDELGRAFDAMVTEMAHAKARVEYLQKVSAWQEVARRLAHEIKNPLTPIQLAVQELATKYRGDDAAYARLLTTVTEIVREEIATLRRLVNDFSAFAKLSPVEPAPLDLGELLNDFLRLHPEWQPHAVVATSSVHPARASVDRVLFGRVLANLVENAVQAAEGAGRTPHVELRVEADDARDRWLVRVDDNGPGVREPDRERIFDPYVTYKTGGTGLGLAIVRKVVIDHGGDVWVESAPGASGGARFTVALPRAPQ